MTLHVGKDVSASTLTDWGRKVASSVNDLIGRLAGYLPLTGGTLTGDLIVPDEAYDATAWNGSLEVPTKNAVRDKIETIAAGGISDADYGDITVSGSGAVWTIDNGAVTLAKQANMATASVVYRKTAGAGAPEVQTLATLKTDLGLTGTNSGDQTSIVGITGTKAQFDTACSDGNFLYVGDVTQYTDELAQDAVGGALTDTATIDFTYNDGANTITADVKAGSIGATELASTAVAAGSYKKADITVDADGRLTAAASSTFRGCLVTKASDQTAANYTGTPSVTWDSEAYDTDNIHSKTSTVTITIASPGVITWVAHGLIAGTPIVFTTTGALPTGLTAGTTYFIVSPATDTFSVSATSGGAAINTSGSQSGVQTATTGPTALIVPSGVTKVRLRAQVSMLLVTASVIEVIAITKNGSAAYTGYATDRSDIANTDPAVSCETPVIAVTSGDFFEVPLTVTTDTSITVQAQRSWFSMEIIE